MAQSPPLDTITRLTAAINRGDIAGMLEFFDPEAILIVQPLAGQAGQIAKGREAIRVAYAGFVSLKPTLRRERQEIVEASTMRFTSHGGYSQPRHLTGRGLSAWDPLPMCSAGPMTVAGLLSFTIPTEPASSIDVDTSRRPGSLIVPDRGTLMPSNFPAGT